MAVFTGSRAATTVRFAGAAGSTGQISVSNAPAVTQPWFRLVTGTGAQLTIAARDLGLTSASNLRDIGGYRTTSGRWVRMGAVYRSSALTLSPDDSASVERLGIAAVYDLRTPAEISKAPDVALPGATYTNINVTPNPPTSLPTTVSGVDQLLEYGNRTFVTDPAATSGYGTLLIDIATSRGPVVINCNAGKDRTGWATAVLLTLLGVPEQTVLQDYLLSNTYYLGSPAVQSRINAAPPAAQPVIAAFQGVKAQYLQAGFDQVTQTYGSMYGYAVHGLGLNPRLIRLLQSRLISADPGGHSRRPHIGQARTADRSSPLKGSQTWQVG